MGKNLSILLVDDDEEEFILLKSLVRSNWNNPEQTRIQLTWVSDFQHALTAFDQRSYDVYLIDYHLGEWTGVDLLREAALRGVDEPLILLTGQGSYDIDQSAMEEDAADYLVKADLTLPLLERTIRYARERKQVQKLLRERADEMEALHTATAALLSTLELEALLIQILDASIRAFPQASQAWLHLQEDLVQGIHPQPFTDPRICLINDSINNGTGIAGIPTNKPIRVSDLQNHSETLPSFFPGETLTEARSLLSAPLCKGEVVFGALSLAAKQAGTFSHSQLQLLDTFAATANAAIQNAVLHAEIQRLAREDPLTGLYNRRALVDLGQREVDRCYRFERPLALILFDLDHFKEINELYGHQAGDQVLRAVTDRCRATIRHTDILGRYGGDEFVIILPETDLPTARGIAERILHSITYDPISTHAGLLNLSTSMGVTRSTPQTASLVSLLDQADQALYRAKESGRSRVEIL